VRGVESCLSGPVPYDCGCVCEIWSGGRGEGEGEDDEAVEDEGRGSENSSWFPCSGTEAGVEGDEGCGFQLEEREKVQL
jgi:hypothetical protein